MSTPGLLGIVEDALLAAAGEEKSQDEWRNVVIDLAARVYVHTGFEADAIRAGYVWTPDASTETFAADVERVYRGKKIAGMS